MLCSKQTIPLVWNRDITAPKWHSGSINSAPEAPNPTVPAPRSLVPPVRHSLHQFHTETLAAYIWNFKCIEGKCFYGTLLLGLLFLCLVARRPLFFRLICPDAERALCLRLLAQKTPRLTCLAVMLMFAAGYLKDAMLIMLMMLVAPCSLQRLAGNSVDISRTGTTRNDAVMDTRRADMLHTSPLPPSSALLQVNFEAPKGLLPTPPVKGPMTRALGDSSRPRSPARPTC
ncbi:hypothetical protein GGI42DRAFT_112876 [Trichoderma sp. SZMC 28013]